MEKTIYDLSLHEELDRGRGNYVLRVPGGWIYKTVSAETRVNTFVPYNNEFDTRLSEQLEDDFVDE